MASSREASVPEEDVACHDQATSSVFRRQETAAPWLLGLAEDLLGFASRGEAKQN